jgi:hypothetical protein
MSTMAEEPSSEQPQEDWVRVRHRKGRRSGGNAAPAGAVSSSVPIPSTPSLTLEQVKQDYDRFAGHWKSSPSSFRLQELLSNHAASSTSSNVVTKAICFGLGTFDPADGAWEQKRKVHVQLAAFLTIVEHLQHTASQEICCFFQDPIFNSVDKAFIASLGHRVVESPTGFELLEPSTLAFGIHLYRDVYSQIIATHIPAMFVGTPYEVWEE